MNKPFPLLFAALLLTCLPAISQDHYAAGKIYTLGDTLTGYVNSQHTARYLKFKAGDGNVTEYTPHQVLGFERDGQIYLSKEAETNPYGEKTKEPLFMQQLVRGKVSLYYYKERDNAEHYWAEKEGKMLELHGGRKAVEVNGSKYLKSDKTYQVFLQQLFSDCSTPNLHLCAFTKKSLTEAVYNYNVCAGEQTARNQYKEEKISIHPGLKVGANFFSEASGSYQLSPSLGLFVNIPISRANRVFSGQVEVVYNQYAVAQIPSSVVYKFVDVGALFRATYPKGHVRPFGAAGVAYALGLGQVRRVPDLKYISGKEGRPKLALEAGLQVPLKKRFVYAAARYDKFLNTPKGYYRLFNVSLGVGL
ncbi:MAG: hypothetical protein ICV83_05470 [Cytophagales bacterium]|nr:hypothetical protein [Cytophagales bacterium]